MARRFLLGKAPFIRSVDEKRSSTTRIMIDVIIALIPIILFGFVYNGLIPAINDFNTHLSNGFVAALSSFQLWVLIRPLVNVLVGALVSAGFEALYFVLFRKVRGFKNVVREVHLSYAVLPGIFLALVLPVTTPLWMIVLGCFFANIVFKMLFGGFGHNIFNPALIAYVLLIAAFGGLINDGYSEFLKAFEHAAPEFSNIAGVTPLGNLSNLASGITKEGIIDSYGGIWNFLLGTIPGSLGETSALLCIVAFIYLTVRKVIDWYVPTIYVGTVFVLTMIIGFVNGWGLWYPLFNVLSGGLLFGAVFMATEPVTTPKNPCGKVIFSFGLGILTVLFRLVGSMPEGVATSILFMCLLTPMIDRFASILRANKVNVKNSLTLAVVILLMVGVSAFSIIKMAPKAEEPQVNYEYVDSKQSFANGKFNEFEVTVTDGENETALVFALENNAYKLVSGELELSDEQLEAITAKLKAAVNSNGYVISSTGDKFLVSVKGMGGNMKVEFTIEGSKIVKMEVLSHGESVDGDHYDSYQQVQNALDTLPGALVAAGKDFETVENIASATVTSNALKQAYKVASAYAPVKFRAGYVGEKDGKLYVYTKGMSNMVVEFEYFGLTITNMQVVEHGESTTPDHYDGYQQVQNAIDTLPGALVAAGKDYASVEGVSGATVTSNGLKKAYEMAYKHLQAKADKGVVVSDENNELVVVIKGYQKMQIKFTYEGSTITSMVVIEHNETVDHIAEAGTALQTLPGKLVSAGSEHASVEGVSGATYTSTALKTAYKIAYEYLQGGNE